LSSAALSGLGLHIAIRQSGSDNGQLLGLDFLLVFLGLTFHGRMGGAAAIQHMADGGTVYWVYEALLFPPMKKPRRFPHKAVLSLFWYSI